VTDPKKMAAMALEVLPPPDRLKRPKVGGAAEDAADGGADDAEEADSGDKAGAMAMEDMDTAATPAEKFAAFKRAVQAAGSGD
jgi:hypothetical protein